MLSKNEVVRKGKLSEMKIFWNSGQKRVETAHNTWKRERNSCQQQSWSRFETPRGAILLFGTPSSFHSTSEKWPTPEIRKSLHVIKLFEIRNFHMHFFEKFIYTWASLAKCNSSLIWLIPSILYWISTDFCRNTCIYTGPVLKHTWSSVRARIKQLWSYR